MFLQNAWYVIEWQARLKDQPVQRRVLNHPVVLYRLADGEPIALEDRCPHRFAPLGDGKVIDGMIECPYHGLRFDRTGMCVHNPHGEGIIPPNARVSSYPLMERHGAIWIWMGDKQLADPAKIPDFSAIDDPDLASSHDHLNVEANYQLVTDNLLDLTHAEFIHADLGNKGFSERARQELKQDGDTLLYSLFHDNEKITNLFQLVWDRQDTHGNLRSVMNWTSPANLRLEVGYTYLGAEYGDGPKFLAAHFLTPQTETSTHYFWKICRNRRQDDAMITQLVHDQVKRAFGTEDGPMIQRVQERMEGKDFWSLQPSILTTDAAAIRARRILAKMIRRELGEISDGDERQLVVGEAC